MPTKTYDSNVARDNWRELLDTAMTSDNYVVITRYGKPVAAVLGYEDFLAIQDALVDAQLERQAVLAYEEWLEDPSTARPWEEVKAELVEEGLLDERPALALSNRIPTTPGAPSAQTAEAHSATT